MPLDWKVIDQLEQYLQKDLRQELDQLMDKIADMGRDHANFYDDTGSLAESITGYEAKVGQWNKNVHRWLSRYKTREEKLEHAGAWYGSGSKDSYHKMSRSWETARLGLIKSRWIGIFPENTPEHYRVYYQEVDLGEERIPTGIITSFVEYAQEVEDSEKYGGTFHRMLRLVEEIAPDLIGAKTFKDRFMSSGYKPTTPYYRENRWSLAGFNSGYMDREGGFEVHTNAQWNKSFVDAGLPDKSEELTNRNDPYEVWLLYQAAEQIDGIR